MTYKLLHPRTGFDSTHQLFSELRDEVAGFAIEMEVKLRRNDHKGGWDNDDPRRLMDRIVEEYYELWSALANGTAQEITEECADIANFTMMISDIVSNGKWKGSAT